MVDIWLYILFLPFFLLPPQPLLPLPFFLSFFLLLPPFFIKIIFWKIPCQCPFYLFFKFIFFQEKQSAWNQVPELLI